MYDPYFCTDAVRVYLSRLLKGGACSRNEEVTLSVNLGEIKKLRMNELWKHEEFDFTPWLATEENIQRLSEAIDMELQVEGVEVKVGPFTADILAKDGSGSYVVIENQFNKTDHDHLGKMLTYAATLGANTIVWIAERFRDEHQKVIEWLNENTTDALSFFAVEAEILVIDESRPALRFNVLSEPTAIARQATAVKTSGGMTETKAMQLEFWSMFRERLLDRKVVPNAHAARAQNWFDVSIGRAGAVISNFANPADDQIGTRLYIRNRVADVVLPKLEAEKETIESEIGEPLQWNASPENRDKIIALTRNVSFEDRGKWPEYCDWLAERVAKFRAVFGSRLKTMDLSTG